MSNQTFSSVKCLTCPLFGNMITFWKSWSVVCFRVALVFVLSSPEIVVDLPNAKEFDTLVIFPSAELIRGSVVMQWCLNSAHLNRRKPFILLNTYFKTRKMRGN